MKITRRAELLSALLIMTLVTSNSVTPAMASQMKSDTTIASAHLMSAREPASIKEEVVNNRKYQIARIVIPAKPEDVWTALTTYDRATDIYENVKELKMVHDNGANKVIEFNVVSMGGLVKYEYALAIKELKAEKRIEWKRHSGAFKVNEGWWQLTPSEHGTLVTYAKFIDGGLLIPQYMVNNELRKIMPSVLSNLRTAVLKEHIASR